MNPKKPSKPSLQKAMTLSPNQAAQLLLRGKARFRHDASYFELTTEEQIALQLDYEASAQESWRTKLTEIRQMESKEE